MTEIRARLDSLRDDTYAAFLAKLIPNIKPESIIGVRTPALRSFAKSISKTPEAAAFIKTLPHACFEENQLHSFLLSEIKDFDLCLAEVERFLPYIDNWATCDQLSPRVFAKQPERLLPAVDRWLQSDQVYTVRFGIGVLMRSFLDARFLPEYPQRVAAIRSSEYYVQMMQAWYFATALAKQYEAILPFLKNRMLDSWVHNKTIQKATESFRITADQKTELKTLRRREPAWQKK